MKKGLLILALGAMMMSACDKVEDYVVPSGAVSAWKDGASVENKSHRAYLEKFTGVQCTNCPLGDNAITKAQETYKDNLIAVSIHKDAPFPEQQDFRTEDGNALINEFIKGMGIPQGLINRAKKDDGTLDFIKGFGALSENVELALKEPAKIAISANAQMKGQTAEITVDLEFLETIAEPLTLTVELLEDSLIAAQAMPKGAPKMDYVHNHILRDFITDLWGMEVEAKGEKGECRTTTLKYKLAPEWKANHCHIIAFVANKENGKVLNAVACSL